MKKELASILCERYPLLFSERVETTKEGGKDSNFHFACGDGWFDLIDTLCERLQFWTEHNKAPQAVVIEVKEKWGELVFYTRNANEEQQGMIAMTRAMSARLCEKCGKPGQTLVHDSWHLTRCSEHAPDEIMRAPLGND